MTTTAQRDQEAQWSQGQRKRAYASSWVIVTLSKRLAPENVTLAHRLMDDFATSQLFATGSPERVDCGNGEAAKRDAAIDAQRRLEGYRRAIVTRVLAQSTEMTAARAQHCFEAIVEGRDAEETRAACGYQRGSYAMMVSMVQLVMSLAQEYHDENQTARLTHKANMGTTKASSEFAPARSP